MCDSWGCFCCWISGWAYRRSLRCNQQQKVKTKQACPDLFLEWIEPAFCRTEASTCCCWFLVPTCWRYFSKRLPLTARSASRTLRHWVHLWKTKPRFSTFSQTYHSFPLYWWKNRLKTSLRHLSSSNWKMLYFCSLPFSECRTHRKLSSPSEELERSEL